MKVFSTALIAALVSVPAFGSVTVSVPQGVVNIKVIVDRESGEAQIVGFMGDDSTIKLADTTEKHIASSLPIQKVQAYENYSNIFEDESGNVGQTTVGPSTFSQQVQGGRTFHKRIVDIYEHVDPSSSVSSVTGGFNTSHRIYRNNRGERRGSSGQFYGDDGLPPITPGPAPYPY